MSTAFESPPSTPPANKTLWAAVGVLAVVVLATGAALIHIQTRPEEPRMAVLPPTTPASMEGVAAASAALTAPVTPSGSDITSVEKRIQNSVSGAPNVAKHAAINAASAARAGAPAASGTGMQAVTPKARPVRANCGKVESVTPLQRDGTAGGVGAVAGAVLGAVAGNQVGGGSGKTVATIVGAVGGGVAGNAVEKKMNKSTIYQVRVRMEDGSTRTVEQATPVTVGARVIIDGETLRAAAR